MILLLDAHQGAVRYCLRRQDRTIMEGEERQIDRLKGKLCQLNIDYDVRIIGYRVENGGVAISRSVTERHPSLAAHIGEDPYFGPNKDGVMRELLIFCWERFVSSRHFVLCDSAFYLNMPRCANVYAIPLEYADAGLVKHGRNGLVHEWAFQRLVSVKGTRPAKVVTVYLDERTDVVALRDGQPVLSSQGFSDFGGLMSQTGCGAIDTSIVLQLFSAGHSLESIYQILSQESGFKALMGERHSLRDLMTRNDPRATLARDIFSYQLLKTIGACAAILEGVEAVVFVGDGHNELQDWAHDFLRELEFLGFKRRKSWPHEDIILMTESASVEAYYFTFNKWSFMAELLNEQA